MGCCRHVPVSRQVLAEGMGHRPFPAAPLSSINHHPHNDERPQVRIIRCSVSTYGIDKECKTHSPMTHAFVCLISSRVSVRSMQDQMGIIELSKVSHRIGSSTRFVSHRRLNNSSVSFIRSSSNDNCCNESTSEVEVECKYHSHPMTCTIVRIISSRVLVLFMHNIIEIIELSRCHNNSVSRLRDSSVTVDLIIPSVARVTRLGGEVHYVI